MAQQYGVIMLWSEASRRVIQHFGTSVRLALVPVSIFVVDYFTNGLAAFLDVAYILAMAWFCFCWMRLCVMDEAPGNLWSSLDKGDSKSTEILIRILRFTGWFGVFLLLAFIFSRYLAFIGEIAERNGNPVLYMFVTIVSILLVAVVSRVFSILAEMAAGDISMTLKQAFASTRGKGLELALCLAVILLVLVFVLFATYQQIDTVHYRSRYLAVMFFDMVWLVSLHFALIYTGALTAVQYLSIADDRGEETATAVNPEGQG